MQIVNSIIVLHLLPFSTSLLPPIQVIMAQTTKRADFEAVFPKLAEEILGHAKKYNLPDNALAWFEKVRFNAYKHLGPQSYIS